MSLEKNKNYIVSGLERSGTSMLMQILKAAELPVAFDDERKADESNPKGYYELEGGKIINRLMENSFSFEKYKGQFIKITSYGIKFLPKGDYKIIYSERNIEEILDSMERMAQISDENREETKDVFIKLNDMIKQKIKKRDDADCLFVNYNQILENPHENIKKIHEYLNLPKEKLNDMINVVDNRLYRQRRKK